MKHFDVGFEVLIFKNGILFFETCFGNLEVVDDKCRKLLTGVFGDENVCHFTTLHLGS